MPDTIDSLARLGAERNAAKPMVIDPETRISYADLDTTS
jgi:hypothetical protein